jgi:hypothetical protein
MSVLTPSDIEEARHMQTVHMLRDILEHGRLVIESQADEKVVRTLQSTIEDLLTRDALFSGSNLYNIMNAGPAPRMRDYTEDAAAAKKRLLFKFDQQLGTLQAVLDQDERNQELRRRFPVLKQPNPSGSGDSMSSKPGPKLFVSHSNVDKNLAESIVELLMAAMPGCRDSIRCSSVEGHRFKIGVKVADAIFHEAEEADYLIALVTPASKNSDWMFAEIVARMVLKKPFSLLIAPYSNVNDLREPYRDYNAAVAQNTDQIHELLEDISRVTGD